MLTLVVYFGGFGAAGQRVCGRNQPFYATPPMPVLVYLVWFATLYGAVEFAVRTAWRALVL